jgi:hypothetical protein
MGWVRTTSATHRAPLAALVALAVLAPMACVLDRGGRASSQTDSGRMDSSLPRTDAGPPCAASCDDGLACTIDRCVAGACTNVPDDSACTEMAGGRCDPVAGCQYGACSPATCVGSACESAACTGGVCVRTSLCGGTDLCCGGACVPAGCEDGNPCTDDRCDGTGCVHENNTAGCDDGNACTHGDSCRGGACEGDRIACDDENPCTDDSCDDGSGCHFVPNSEPCTDGDFCTEGDQCQDGECRPGGPRSCGPSSCICSSEERRCMHHTTGMDC